MDFSQDRAIYLQIADYITENILSGTWKENDRIPSSRDLAVSIEVNPNTVVRTYNYLQEKGIVENQRGIGYFITDRSFERAKELERERFCKEQLPVIFRAMDLIGITWDELRREYEKPRGKRPEREPQASADLTRRPRDPHRKE